ncbi:hypothetical protein QA601_10465 [Chitinispirillales bacterium ANBcel5]|uniref:hypothetical protein n=1 Tax=Cellulosispirillum alkaliphilum TaxID=3039283 RepID=UPI002A50C8CF|nr:hypothetical protein [Chitinispirillales bacterium ANBcel5]
MSIDYFTKKRDSALYLIVAIVSVLAIHNQIVAQDIGYDTILVFEQPGVMGNNGYHIIRNRSELQEIVDRIRPNDSIVTPLTEWPDFTEVIVFVFLGMGYIDIEKIQDYEDTITISYKFRGDLFPSMVTTLFAIPYTEKEIAFKNVDATSVFDSRRRSNTPLRANDYTNTIRSRSKIMLNGRAIQSNTANRIYLERKGLERRLHLQ